MNRKAGSIALWIVSIAYTCAMTLSLLLMIGSAVALSFAGLSRVVGLVIMGVGFLGCLGLMLAGGAAIVSAVTVFCMKKFGGRPEAHEPKDEKRREERPGRDAEEPDEKG